VLTAVVDAALAVTSCETRILLLRKRDDLAVTVARDRTGRDLDANDLRVPTTVIKKALHSRRDLALDVLRSVGGTGRASGHDGRGA